MAILDDLHAACDDAVAFAENWPERYRDTIFSRALDRLLRTAGGHFPQGAGSARTPAGGDALSAPSGNEAISRVAKHLGLPEADVDRVLSFGEGGAIKVLARVPGESRKEQQLNLTLVYLMAKEMGLGERSGNNEELRALAKDHGCYDAANFAAYLKRGTTDGVLRSGATDGGYMASKKGLEIAAALLKQAAAE